MVSVGFTLSSEEFGKRDLVRYAVRAEEAGFEYALISDHFHPWIDEQGHSPFVWVVIGAVAQATKPSFKTGIAARLRLRGRCARYRAVQKYRASS